MVGLNRLKQDGSAHMLSPKQLPRENAALIWLIKLISALTESNLRLHCAAPQGQMCSKSDMGILRYMLDIL
jgi:hypothetical protein